MHAPLTADLARDVLSRHMIVKDQFDFVMDLERSHGPYIYDARSQVRTAQGEVRALREDEHEYLDFYTQFASWPVAYNHPRLCTPELRERLARATVNKIANADIMTVEKAEYVQMMSEVAIHDGLDYLFLISGGALAVENALKAAFDWKVRLNFTRGILRPESEYVIAHFKQAFHGRSGYTMSLTNTDPDKVRFFPKFEHWPRIDNPKAVFPLELHAEELARREDAALDQLHAALKQHPHTIAAVILETVQGEGGDNHFRPEFFQKLRAFTDAEDILLILDEVQAGCGLTGRFWAYQHMGIVPDLIAFGKKMQTCGVLASRTKFNRVHDHAFKMMGRLNSTWGGDLSDMVRATELLKIVRDEQLVENAARMGAILLVGLEALRLEFPKLIHNTRALGLMAAFDFYDVGQRDRYREEMYRQRILTLSCGTHSVRLRPMLDIRREHLETFLEASRRALHAVHR